MLVYYKESIYLYLPYKITYKPRFYLSSIRVQYVDTFNHIQKSKCITTYIIKIQRTVLAKLRIGRVTTYIEKCGLNIARRSEQPLGTPRNRMDYASSTHTTIVMFSYLDFSGNIAALDFTIHHTDIT